MASSIDPITFSVVLNRFNSIASEMTLVLERAAMTAILALSRDYSCCIYDARGRQVAMVDAIPVHTSSMSMLLNEVTKAFGDNIFEGDVIVVNSAYHGNTHIGDLVAWCRSSSRVSTGSGPPRRDISSTWVRPCRLASTSGPTTSGRRGCSCSHQVLRARRASH